MVQQSVEAWLNAWGKTHNTLLKSKKKDVRLKLEMRFKNPKQTKYSILIATKIKPRKNYARGKRVIRKNAKHQINKQLKKKKNILPCCKFYEPARLVTSA